jgi:cAMP phosphodiesterase
MVPSVLPSLSSDSPPSATCANSIQGAGGGPIEDNITGLLVRSASTIWAKSSILAVDAGVHLSAIIRILNEHLPNAVRVNDRRKASYQHTGSPFPAQLPGYFSAVNEARSSRAQSPAPSAVEPKLQLTSGPFTGLLLPYESAKANAAYFCRMLVSTFLITHPHLDHLSGFAINTASFQQHSRIKKLAALPSTIDAIKSHIFNDVIWPNLTDEEGGVGLVSFQRLVEGGNVALGEGEGKGYIEICEGLAVKAWSVSHGQCVKQQFHRSASVEAVYPVGRRPSRQAGSPSGFGRRPSHHHIEPHVHSQPLGPTACVYDSSAFFIRDDATGQELLVFGDVEPDSISDLPRTARVWDDAAPKIVNGILRAVFIECSYDDSQPDELLFGHLAPRHLIDELTNLGEKVHAYRTSLPPSSGATVGATVAVHQGAADTSRKRKRQNNGSHFYDELDGHSRRGRNLHRGNPWATHSATLSASSISPTARSFSHDLPHGLPHGLPHDLSPARSPTPNRDPEEALDGVRTRSGRARETAFGDARPLTGLEVVVIHIKDTLKDGPPPGEIILQQLETYERAVGLGCKFRISESGESLWF